MSPLRPLLSAVCLGRIDGPLRVDEPLIRFAELSQVFRLQAKAFKTRPGLRLRFRHGQQGSLLQQQQQ